MNRSPWIVLWTQTTYALFVFACFLIGMEAVMPGFVTPYLDPVPFAAGAVFLSVIHALFINDASSRCGRVWTFAALAVFAALAFLVFQDGPGLRATLAIGFGIAMIALSSVFLLDRRTAVDSDLLQ